MYACNQVLFGGLVCLKMKFLDARLQASRSCEQLFNDLAHVSNRLQSRLVSLLRSLKYGTERDHVSQLSTRRSESSAMLATHVLFRLIKHDQATGTLIEDSMEHFVQDHLTQSGTVERLCQYKSLWWPARYPSTHLLSTSRTGCLTSSAM